MKKNFFIALLIAFFCISKMSVSAQTRRPVDSQHPLWMIHVDVWNKADPQKIIDLIPSDIKPYVCINLSLSCQYDTERNVYKMPQNAVLTYKSWATVCQANGLWFTCQPASGGHTHIQDNDLDTFEYFFTHYPNFLGWNYAEQFWGFDAPNDISSSTQASRLALFAKLVPMHHKYGGFLTVSFCGNIWSYGLNPVGMMKRNSDLYNACKLYPEAIVWLYKYTTSSCWYNNESVTFSPFISGLAKNYGVRYDNCGWNGALDALYGSNSNKKYPTAAGIGTVMEQTCVNGGAIWDGPELIWTEDFLNLNNTTVDGYMRRNWGRFASFDNAWIDMWRKIIDGTMYIPTRKEVVGKTKVVIVNDVNSGTDEDKYASWGNLYDGLYKQNDPFNKNDGQWMNNLCYFKKTGRYGTIPVTIGLYDDTANSIPVQVKKSTYSSRWISQSAKVNEFNKYYPEVSSGDLYVNRYRNQLVAYTPYSYSNSHTWATGIIPLQYNTCSTLKLELGKLCSGVVREYSNRIDLYLNNFRSDTTSLVLDRITVTGAKSMPSFTVNNRQSAKSNTSSSWNSSTGTFVLSINHNGPVDVSISCEGNNVNRSIDVLSSSKLSTPKQPSEYRGDVIIEAEDMDFKNIKSCVIDPYNAYPSVSGHAGNGFMDMGTNTAGSLRHTFNAKYAEKYNVIIRYTNKGTAAQVNAKVNGIGSNLTFQTTSTNQWKEVVLSNVSFNEGSNTLVITNVGGVNAYIDQVIYSPVNQSSTTTPEVSGNSSFVFVTSKDYKKWTTADASNMELGYANCIYNAEVSADVIYGDANVNYLNYADLSNVSKLVVIATEGEPRFLFNRTENNGTIRVELPRDKDLYETVTTNSDGSKTYTVDVAKIVQQYGFAHLHAIKGANYTKTNVKSIKMSYAEETIGTALTTAFDKANCRPEGWIANDAGTILTSGDATIGPRVMQFTGGGDFQYGFYARQQSSSKDGYIEYGSTNNCPITINRLGNYCLTFNCAAWAGAPYLKADIYTPGGNMIASTIVECTKNLNKSTATSTSNSNSGYLSFFAYLKGNYKVRFTPCADANGNGGNWLEVIVANVNFRYMGNPLLFTKNNYVNSGWKILDNNNIVATGEATIGPRIFRFPNSGLFNHGLYVRSTSDVTSENYAEFGSRWGYGLSFLPGNYTVSYNCAAWSGSPYVKCEIINEAGNTVASTVTNCSLGVNKNTNVQTDVAAEGSLTFNISSRGNYRVRWTPVADAQGTGAIWLETIIGNIKIKQNYGNNAKVYNFIDTEDVTTSITTIPQVDAIRVYYNLQGQQVKNPTRGIYIVNGKKILVK